MVHGHMSHLSVEEPVCQVSLPQSCFMYVIAEMNREPVEEQEEVTGMVCLETDLKDGE